MKKILLLVGLVLVAFGGFSAYRIYESKSYYPDLPINGVSKKEAVSKAEDSEGKLVKLTNENGYEWYTTKTRDINKVDGMVETHVGQHGWTPVDKAGAVSFYEKQEKQVDKLAVETKTWKDYMLINIEEAYDD